eukprot:TRINITY_DN16677_c0_g1_i1.p1 TRINITY_DN16677_c0_g1~~TRINITY_DN16677_c0_g1_i1.p1  ORF type:complete len:165 (-),score=50.15 TRINITY_DN16677_c0_g1_i1:27-521(-)
MNIKLFTIFLFLFMFFSLILSDSIGDQFLSDCENGNIDRVVWYIEENNGNINYRSEESDFNSALNFATQNNHIELAEYLLENDIDIDLINKSNNEAAIHIAIANENKEFVQLLLDYGANTRIFSKKGSPIVLASQIGDEEIKKMLKKELVRRNYIKSKPIRDEL